MRLKNNGLYIKHYGKHYSKIRQYIADSNGHLQKIIGPKEVSKEIEYQLRPKDDLPF